MIDLEERIRRAAELLDHEAVDVRMVLEPAARSSPRTDERTRWLARLAAAVVLVLGVAGVAFALSRTPGDGLQPGSAPEGAPSATTTPTADTAPATSAPARTSVAPTATLPPMADLIDVPITVAASAPTHWYRLQPDLDVAWYSGPGSATSMLCFRSPSLTATCQSDEARPADLGGEPIVIQGAGAQYLLVAVGGLDAPSISLTLEDGSVVTGTAETDPRTGWSVARVDVPTGLRPVRMWMSFLADQVGGPGHPDSTAPERTVADTTASALGVPSTTAPPEPAVADTTAPALEVPPTTLPSS